MKVIVQPSTEPITVAQAKAWLRVDYDTDDSLIEVLITSARTKAEHHTNRAFIEQTISEVTAAESELRLSVGDVLAIVSVTVEGETLDPALYELKEDELGALVEFDTEPLYPPTIVYTAGYGPDIDDVPKAIVQAMLLAIAEMYENRTDRLQRLPTASYHLLNTVRRWVT